MADSEEVPHVQGDSGAADLFRAGGDVGEPATKLEAQGHETLQQSKARSLPRLGATDAKLLRDEGADLPHNTTAGNVQIQGPADREEPEVQP